MSFFGLTDYVMAFDTDLRPVPIPESFRNYHPGAIKRVTGIPGDAKHWISLSYCNPIKHPLFSKSVSHPKDIFGDLMARIGFKGVHLIRLTDYHQDSEDLNEKLEQDVLKVFDLIKH